MWSEGKYPQPSLDNDRDQEHKRDDGLRDRDHEKERLEKAAANLKWAKPISELDLSNCEQCTPSYRLLPKNVCGCSLLYVDLLFLSSSFVSLV